MYVRVYVSIDVSSMVYAGMYVLIICTCMYVCICVFIDVSIFVCIDELYMYVGICV